MELECDLSKITSEELLRKMWQQSEDASRKKEIRSQLYKLRESRLRDLYQGDIMAENTVAGFGKDPLATSHGDALADQSFQSLKSKEIRDSLSPTEMKFQSMTLNNPNTTGWNVQSSKEITPDGRGFRAETVATTDGVESVNGGIAEFKGRNEQLSSAHHQGDDKNFVKKAMESSKSHLQEKVVIGDENSGRTEVRTSSSTSTSSSQVFQSSTNVEYDDGYPVQQGHPQKYLTDSNRLHQQDLQQRQQLEQQRLLEEQRRYEQQFQQQRQQHLTTEQLSTSRQNTEQKNVSQNVQTQETHEQNKRYVDMDKASPEYQQHVQHLMQQPGEIISNTVEYPKPNVKMITTVKRLPDGTIVRNKRYETEELQPTTPNTTRSTNQTNQPRRDSQQQQPQPSRNYPVDNAPSARPSHDMVDSGSVPRYVQDVHNEDVETKFSSVKKSSRKFSTETTSETIQEYDDRYPQGEPAPRAKPVTNDFSTHGFPSVRPNKPTQEYPSERPQSGRPTQGYPATAAPQHPAGAVVPHYTDAPDNITERRIPTKDGEVIIVSSEKKRNYKTSTNSERIVETEHVIRDDQPYQQIPDKVQDFSTHGFPSVREPLSGQQPKNYPSERQMQPQDQQDFPLDKFSPGRRIIKHSSPHGDDDVIVVSAQKSRTAKHSTNTERVIEHEIIRDDQPSGYPRTQPQTDNSPYGYTVTTPGDQMPQAEFPSSPRKPGHNDYSTQGFPSVRTPGQTGAPGDYPEDARPTSRPAAGLPSNYQQHPGGQDFTTQGFPSVRTPGQTGAPGDHSPYGDYPEGTSKTPGNDFSTQGYPSAKTPTRPAAGLPSNHQQHPRGQTPSQDFTTQGFPSVKTPSKEQPTSHGYPANIEPGRTNGTAEPRAPNTTTTKTQPRTPSPQKYKSPTPTVRETTERIIRKEKEVDSAHRAFAASLRSSSPIDHHVRRDSYTTDSHTRHTPRSSISSTKTFRRDMREGSHDSAPSEISRISTTTVTRNTPPRTVGGKTVVTRVVTTKTGQGSNDTLNVTSPRATKSPSPAKSVTTTTTTTTRTVPKASEKSPTKKPSSQPQPQPAPNSRSSTPSYNSRKPISTTSVMTDDYDDDDKFKQPTTSPLSPTSRSRTPQKISPSNDKPQDDWQTRPQPDNKDERRTVNRETTFDKEDNKEPSQPATKPNYEQPNIEWVIVDDVDHDDDDDDDNDSFAPEVVDSNINVKKTTTKLITHEKQTPLSPTRKPKTTTTTVTTKQFPTQTTKTQPKTNDKSPLKIKPSDTKTPQRPLTDSRKPNQTPQKSLPKNVDNKQQPKAPRSTTPSYTSPLRKPVNKTTSEDTTTLRKTLKTTQVVKDKTTKLIESEKPKRKPLTSESKTKPQTPGRRKPGEETIVTVTEITRKRLPGEKTPRTPYDEPLKGKPGYRKPQDSVTPDDEPRQGTPGYKKPQGVNEEPNEYSPVYRKPQGDDYEPFEDTPGYRKPQGIYDEPKEYTPGYRKPQNDDNEPLEGSPGFRKPQGIYEEPNQRTPGSRKPQDGNEPFEGSPDYRKPQAIYDEPYEHTPGYKKPHGNDNEPFGDTPGYRKPQDIYEEPNQRTPGYRKPHDDNEPFESSPGFKTPQGVYDEPNEHTPGYRKPQGVYEEPISDRPGQQKPQRIFEEQITITETSQNRYPGREAPKRPDRKPNQRTPGSVEPQDTDDEPYQGSPAFGKPKPNERLPGSRKPYGIDDEPNQQSPGYRNPQGTDDEPREGYPGYRKPQDSDEPMEGIPAYGEPKPNEHTPGFRKPQGTDDEPREGYPGYRRPQDTDEPIKGSPAYGKPQPNEQAPGFRKPQGTDDEPNKGSPGYRKPPSPRFQRLQATFDVRSPHYKKPQDIDDEPKQGSPVFRKPQDTDDEPRYDIPGFRKPQDIDNDPIGDKPGYQRPQQIIEEQITITETSQNRYPTREAPKRPDTELNQGIPGYRKPQGTDDEPREGSPGFRKPQDTEPYQGSPGYRKPQDTDFEPKQGTPGYRKPQDTDYQPKQGTPGYRKPHDTDDEPSSPSYRKPQEPFHEPQPGSPGYRKPSYTDNEPNRLTPGSRKPQDTNDEPQEGLPGYKRPQDITEEEITITQTTQKRYPERPDDKPDQHTPGTKKPYDSPLQPFETDEEPGTPGYRKQPQKPQPKPKSTKPGDEEPQEGLPGYRRPQDITEEEITITQTTQKRYPERPDDKPEQRTPGTKKPYESPLEPVETDEEPGYRKLPKPKSTKPGIKPSETEDEEYITESETTLRTTQKTVAKHIQKFESNTLTNKSPKPQKITKSPTKEQPQKKLPKTPGKETSTTRKAGQKYPEEPKDTKSPKPVSPTRTLKKPEDVESFTSTLRTKQVVTKKTTKQVDDEEYPEDTTPETRPKEYKPLDTDDDETVIETSEFIIDTKQKRVVNEEQIIEFEEINYPDKKTPGKSSPTRTQKKPEQPTGKRPQSPTRTQKKPEQKSPLESTDKTPKSPTKTPKKPSEKTPLDDDETYTTTLKSTKLVRDQVTKTYEDEEYPEDKPKDRKPGKPYDTDDEELLVETSEFVTNTTTQKRVVSEKIITDIEEPQYPDEKAPKQKPLKDTKSPTRGVAPTKTPKKPGQEPSGKRPQSPTKPVSPTRSPKKPGQKLPEEPVDKKPTGKRPQSPTRTPKKPTKEDETFKTTLRTTKTVIEKTSKTVEDEEYPDEKTPYKKGDKPGTKPKQRKPDSDKPYDTDEEEIIEETTCVITEKLIPGFKEPKSPNRGDSPTRSLKKPLKKTEKPEKEPKGEKPLAEQPSDTDEDETVIETSELVINTSEKRYVNEQQILELEESYYPDNQRPKSPTRGDSPTRTQKKSGEKMSKEPTGKRPQTKSPTRGASPQKKPGKQEPEKPFGRRPQSPSKYVSPTRADKKPELADKRPKSPTRIQKKPNEKTPLDDEESYTTSITTTKIVKDKFTKEKDDDKYPEYKPKERKPKDSDDEETFVETNEFVSTQKRVVSEKLITEFEEPSYPDKKSPKQKPEKDSKSPVRDVSPTQKKPGQRTPEEPGKRPQSPTRAQKKPQQHKPDSDKPYDTDEQEIIEETTCVITEKLIKGFEEPKSPTRGDSPTRSQKKPEQKLPEAPGVKEPTSKRPQSPTRTPKKPTKEDETFKTSLRTTKIVTEKTTKTIEDEEYPDEKTPYKKGDKPETKPKQRKPDSNKPYDTDEEETIEETTCVITEKLIPGFEEPKSPTRGDSPTRFPKKPGQKLPEEPSGKRPQSPTRTPKKPTKEDETFKTTLRTTNTVTEKTTKSVDDEEYPKEKGDKPKQRKPHSDKPYDTDENELIEETTRVITQKIVREFEEPESPTRGDSPTRSPKKPGHKLPEEPLGKRPQSPTRTQRKPTDENESFTTFKTTTVTTQIVDDKDYPDERTPHKKDDKPESKPKQRQPHADKPYDTDENEITEETTRVVTRKIVREFEEPESPTRGDSPTRSPKKPGQKLPEEPGVKEPSGKRPQSPTRSQKKPTKEDDTFKTTLRTTKTVTEKTSQIVDDEDSSDEKTPYRKGDKPQPKEPKERKPYTNKPFDTDEEENYTETREHFITSKTRKVTEKLIQEFEEPESPKREVSPTRTQKKPGQKPPEEPELKEPTGKRPQSPTRSQKKPTDKDETFKSTLRTTKTITEKTTGDYPDQRTPYKPGDKSDTKPKQRKPYTDKPDDTDEEGIIEETTCVVTEKVAHEFEEPESPTRGVSPTRTQKKPGQKSPEELDKKGPSGKKPHSPTRTHKKPTKEDETFKSTLRTTKTVTEKTTVDEEEYPEGDKPETKPKKQKPYSDKPDDTDEEETYTQTQEHFITSKTRQITEKLIQGFEEPESPKRGVSPTRTQKKQGEPDFKEPTDKRPQSPRKPTNEDETFKSTLKTIKTVTEKTTKIIDDEDYPQQKTPYKTSDKPDKKPKQSKPEDTDEEEIIEETTCMVTEKIIREFEEPESPTRGVSPTRLQKKPGEKSPQQPTGKRPQSPTRTQKQPEQKSPQDEDTLTKTFRNTKIVTKTYESEEFPEDQEPKDKKPGLKEPLVKRSPSPKKEDTTPDGKEPKGTKPKSYRPSETDEDERFRETTEYVIKSTQKPKPKYPGSQEPQEDYPEKQPKYQRPGFEETDDDETFTHTSEFIRHTSQRLITNEQQTFEVEQQFFQPDNKKPVNLTDSPSSPKKEPSPIRKPATKESPNKPSSTTKEPKSPQKTSKPNDETFKKSLRTTETEVEKTKPKQQKPGQIKPKDSDDEETTNETEEYVIETCEKHYVTVKPNEKESFGKPSNEKPIDKKPQDKEPLNKPFTSTYKETTETIEGQTYPEDIDQYPDNKKPSKVTEEPWLPKRNVPKHTTNINEQFIEIERIHKEIPDGAFISKTTEPSTPTSPTFRKKGTGRRDTFEERCRQILGMDTYGDTPGTYKKQPISEEEKPKKLVSEDVKETEEEEDVKNTTIFQVKIEDCDEDDEPLSINSVKNTLHKQIHTTEQIIKEPLRREEPKEPQRGKNEVDEPEKIVGKPKGEKEPEDKSKKPKYPKDNEPEFIETITKTSTLHKKTPKTKSIDETEPEEYSEPENIEETYEEINKQTKKSEIKIIKKSSPTTTPRSGSPTKTTTSPRTTSPTKGKTSPLKETPKRKPSKETIDPKTNKSTPQKPDKETTTIKERLRSSTRKTKSPSKPDQVDGSDNSSPEHSPTRYNDSRRSSNISVTTEIIIEHTDSDTPSKKEKSPGPKKPKDSVFKDIIDSTVLPEKLTRRMPVTERKESAPVHRVTNKDKDSKMSRSTSENLIKVNKKPEPQTLSPKTTPKTEHRRPNKCFATKTINLSATDRLVNSEDMENVIIDIQHAKSSREPSPDKIVPTPVPADLDTGKPRYPDVVQEPEDEQPKRKPQIKNIPIFEEESNSYVGCHITEVEKTHKTTYDSLDYEEQILNNPVVEAPPSLDYPSLDKPREEESLLTVQEKVTRYQNITEEMKKPKTLEPRLIRENEPKTDEEENEEFIRNERIYTSIKLQPLAPQKSPELVRTISRHISRQNEEPEDSYDKLQPEYNKDYVECLVNNKKITKEFEVSHHQQQQQQTAETTEKFKKIQTEKYQQPKDDHDDNYGEDDNDNDDEVKHDDDDELIPFTAMHTTKIEERRQKDILSRPSVFEGRNNKKPSTTTTTTKTPLKCNKSPVKDSEKLRPDNKSRTKPTSAAVTQTTTTTTTTTNKPKQQQSPSQRKITDIDYDELRGSGSIETGVKNIISKQTKVYKNNDNDNDFDISSSSKTNDLKNSYTTTTTESNKKPEKQHMPVDLIPAKNSDVQDFTADNEMIVNVQQQIQEEEEITETQVVNEDLNIETTTGKKIPLTTSPHKKQQPTHHSSTNSSPTDQPLKSKTKDHVLLNLTTESKPLKSNIVTTTTTTSSIKLYDSDERADDIDETVLEPTTTKKKSSSSTPYPTKTSKMSSTITDSVAARRSLFESNNSSPTGTPTKRTPLTSPMSGRRPSYMDHTKSSLEHTRRDSLEINKTNYSRKPSHPDEENSDRNSMVKFEVPQGKRATTPRATSITEDINVEEIFELEVLEKLLETVQSYEIRRRIRAQIRLIKKNQKNDLISSTTEIITKTIKTIKQGSEEPTEVTTKTIKTTKQGSEEPDTASTTTSTIKKSKPETKTPSQTLTKEPAISSSKKEYIFEETYLPSSRRSPKPNRYPYEEEKEPIRKPVRSQSPQGPVCQRNAQHHSPERHHKPEQTEVVSEYAAKTTKKHYYYKDEQEEHEQVEEFTREISPSRKSPSPSRKPHSKNTSPERPRHASPETQEIKERSRSPQTKAPQSSRVTSSRSPDTKVNTSTTVRKSSATYEQQQESLKSTSSKPLTKRITTTTTTTTKGKPEDKTPVWADRKNILKAPSATTPKPKSTSSTVDSRAGYSKTVKSSTSQKMTSNKSSSFVDDDCITSSYGIGPTDENGLPLFGIRALKKKKPTVEPSETTEEVTGYVVEEKYYSDNKSKPKVERKEFIYSTNPEELKKLKEQVEVSSNIKALEDVEVKETRKTALISKGTPALRSSPEDDFLDSTSKYVRRGSVKEMSEKFIQREASSGVTEKSNNYPKAGLILRTNSRKNSRDTDNESENYESYKSTRVQQHHTTTSSVLADSDNEHEYEHEEVASRHSGRFITESESECDSIKTQREFKKVTSSSSSSMATRSFLNSQGEEKVITNVTDCLERMRNADNVVEEGDTAEDQEARALLNKFLGASIIMKGVESSLPAASSNRQSRIITTTTTSNTLSDDDNDDGDNNAKHEVKTTRITKTIKSGSSSTPVTYTTCAIEEIWDEEILKELLEQARTYEERRKIRSRLRELMADREETKQSLKGEQKEAASAPANNPAEEESSASEYEEIIEEVTDYSEAESEVDDKKQNDATTKVVSVEKSPEKEQKAKTEEKSVTVTEVSSSSTKQESQKTEQSIEKTTTKSKTITETETEIVEEVVEEEQEEGKEESSTKKADDKTDSSEKEQKQQKSSTSTTQKTETKEKDGAVVTTTTKVTTRTISGSAAKPASPFAKFKQLDKQNSQQSAKTSK